VRSIAASLSHTLPKSHLVTMFRSAYRPSVRCVWFWLPDSVLLEIQQAFFLRAAVAFVMDQVITKHLSSCRLWTILITGMRMPSARS